ncbi:glycosyltransferase family 4 protein, partial [Candidatus Woesearchaeota archaeon]|nr:glycosyltransferase family 4 protein [Candidatus Woesearchaeota archaeon]
MAKYVEIVPSYPLRYALREKEDYFYWPARMMMDKGFEVEFLTLEPGKKSGVRNGILVRRFNSALSLLSFINRDREIRLVHAHLRPYPPCFFGGFTNKPKVLTPHTYILGSNPVISRLSVLMMNRYDRVIALTPHERDVYLKSGVRKDKVVLLPHPVDYSFYSAPAKNSGLVKKRLDISKGEFVIVTVANIRKCKRMDTLLRAFRVVSLRLPAKLIIVGDDMLWQEKASSVSS